MFLVEGDEGERVLKVYYPNFTIKKGLMRIIQNFNLEMIVKITDYGKTYVEGKNRDYELMEYLRGGTLADYDLNGDYNQFRRIALQCAAALAYCHNNNIIHKDIKPGNYFFRDEAHKEIVLGDFGISSIIEEEGRLHRTTQARTPVYAAPEMYNDVIDGEVEITPAADFYSLGITLMTLWLGENPLSQNERVMMRKKNEGRLPRINELPDRVKMIVQGLTAVNPASRWKYDEVERWFLGEDVHVDISSPLLKYRSFIVDPERNLVADNVHELIPLLMDNERLATSYLYNGRIPGWLEQCGNVKLSSAVKDIIVNRYPADQRAGLMASVYVMEPSYPYTDLRGNHCDDIHSVAISVLSYMDEYALAKFMDYILIERNCSTQTYNNYLSWIRTFCGWMKQRRYIHDDPTDGLHSIKRTTAKNRTVIPDDVLVKVRNYLEEHNKHFLLAAYILHYMFVRPKEMSKLLIGDFHIEKKTLVLHGDQTKNRQSSVVTLPDHIVRLMIDLKVFDYPSQYYLFSDKCMPGKGRRDEKQFRDYWNLHVRKDLRLPACYKFYSLKDTGITNMLRANTDPLSVRDQARHSSLLITNTYTPLDIKEANPLILKYRGVF